MKTILVCDKMQTKYSYQLVRPTGKQFHAEFKPELTPKEMLALGVFGGPYLNDCTAEFPKSWFTNAKLSTDGESRAALLGKHNQCMKP